MSEVIGKILVVGEEQVVGSAGTFRKRMVVIETDEKFSQKIPIDFVQDKCEYLDGYNVGEDVKVSINIRGNEYQGKYYVSLNGWRIEPLGGANSAPQANNAPPMQNNPQSTSNFKEEDDSDLPFN